MVTSLAVPSDKPGLSWGDRLRRVTPIVAAVWLLNFSGCPGPEGIESGTLYKRDVSKGIHDTAPVRGAKQVLALHLEGDAFPCSSCHEGFVGDQGTQALEDQHKDIVFDHGANSSCLNCHNAKNSDTYVDYAGNEIPGDQPTKLCAKCHGPQTREWEYGIHGRTNGHWDAKFGDQVKLDCVQCHDPHKPHFAQMVPRTRPRLSRFQPLPLRVEQPSPPAPPAADAPQKPAEAAATALEATAATVDLAQPTTEGAQSHAN